MRAAVPVAAVLIVAAVLALLLVTREEDDAYRVRAIFDNAGFIIPGEDVKVAGVKVGSIEDVEVTPEFKAAVVLRIDDAGYQDFRSDATCIVRPQSLIGEKYVECRADAEARRRRPRRRGSCARSRTGRTRGSGCCPSRTPSARSTST